MTEPQAQTRPRVSDRELERLCDEVYFNHHARVLVALDLRDCRAERDALAAMVGALREALGQALDHIGEVRKASTAEIADWLTVEHRTAEVSRQYEDRIRREEWERCARFGEFWDLFEKFTSDYALAIADEKMRAGFVDHITHIGMAREELRQPDNTRDGTT